MTIAFIFGTPSDHFSSSVLTYFKEGFNAIWRTQPEEMIMKLQQADLHGSEETPITDAMRSVGEEYVTKVTQADFKGSQAIGLDVYFPQLRRVITQDHKNIYAHDASCSSGHR